MSKKLTMTMLVLLIVSITSFSSPRDLDNRVTDYTTRLELTEEQVDEIKPILEEASRERKGILEQIKKSSKKSEQRRLAKDLKRVEKGIDTQLAKVLTEEQSAEWSRIKEEVKEKA